MISAQLQVALHNSFVSAHGHDHKWITIEHLLLQLMDVPAIQEWLRSRDVDETGLYFDLEHQVSRTETILAPEEVNAQPTVAFRKAIEYATLSAQEAHRPEVTPLDVLGAIVAHPECLAPDSAVRHHVATLK